MAGLAGSAALAQPASAGGPPPPLVCPSAGSVTGNYVNYVYKKILFRCADAGGLAYWTALLDGGLPDRSFTALVDMSDENLVVNNVDVLYDEILERAPTPAERSGAVSNIRASATDAALVSVLYASDEFFNGKKEPISDEQWIAIAYNKILDRDPDGGGAAYYLATFGADGSDFFERFRVAFAMERSDENAQSWIVEVHLGALQRYPTGNERFGSLAYLKGPGNWATFRLWTDTLGSPEARTLANI